MKKVLGDDPFAGSPPAKEAPKGGAKKPPPAREKTPSRSANKAEPVKKAQAAKARPARKEAQKSRPPKPAPAAQTEPLLSAAAPIEAEAARPPEPPPPPPSPTQVETAPATTALVAWPRPIAAEAPAVRLARPLSPFARRYREIAPRSHSTSVDDFGLDSRVAERYDPYLEFLYRRYFRAEASGLQNIPDSGRAIIVASHGGHLPFDSAMLIHAVRREHPARRPVRPLLEDVVFHFPFLGTLMNRIGGVRACQENAERLLLAEQLIAVFPEGTKGTSKLYSERYRLQRFGRGGFVKLALRTQAPIIPTALVGAEETQPLLGKLARLARPFGLPYIPVTPMFPWLGPLGLLPLPSKWYIAFGPPLLLHTTHGPRAMEDPILISQLAEQVRQRIQEMIGYLLQRRRSVLFG